MICAWGSGQPKFILTIILMKYVEAPGQLTSLHITKSFPAMYMTILPKRHKLSIPSLITLTLCTQIPSNISELFSITILMTTETTIVSWDAYLQAQILFYVNLYIVRKSEAPSSWIVSFIFLLFWTMVWVLHSEYI